MPTFERVSVAAGGTEANSVSSSPSISADGRYVAYASFASNLVAGDGNNVSDIFVYDRQTETTERVSVAANGTESDNVSYQPSISPDGRYVTYASLASNLVAGDANGTYDIFVYDRLEGTTERVSVGPASLEGDGASLNPSISGDGLFVTYQSSAGNLVAGDTNGMDDIFVYDRTAGTTERVSVAPGGTDDESSSPSISADGRFVAFASFANNLVLGDGNGTSDIFVHDRDTGAIERVSVATGGTEGNGFSSFPSISADGRYVTFTSGASNLVAGDTNGADDIFVYDRDTGTTERVSVASDGEESNDFSYNPSISGNGRYVTYQSTADNLVAGDTNRTDDVFVYDRENHTTERVSVANRGTEGDILSGDPAISSDGRYVTFTSSATGLIAGDTNETDDIFVGTVNNDPPVIGSNGGGTAATASVAENTAAVTTVTATDAAALTYAIRGGADKALFTIDSATGALSFLTAPDFENPTDAGSNNVYDVVVRASDGVSFDDQALTVTVTNENDNPPVISSNSGAATAALSLAENTTAVMTVTATDADGTTPTYAIQDGADAALFTINGATGALSFKTQPDFENPTDAGSNNVYDVVVRASDGLHFDDQALAITVTNVNDAPIAVDDTATVAARHAITGNVLANDHDADAGDILSVASVQLAGGQTLAVPASGTVEVNTPHGFLTIQANGSYSYLGNDPRSAFTYTVSDGHGGTATGHLEVNTTSGAPADTLTFPFQFGESSVRSVSGETVLTAPDGQAYDVTGVAHLDFADGRIDENDGSPLVDDLFYFARNGDVWRAHVDPDQHFAEFGWKEGRDPSADFSTSGYLSANPDVAKAGMNPLQHYDQFGWKEGRDPSADFDTQLYLEHNPDVRAAGMDPLAHHLQFGQAEGRQAYAAVGTPQAFNHGSFDAEYYLLANPDVGKAGMDPYRHFDTFGWLEGRNPNAFFDTKGYLETYADVAAAKMNPLTHYDQFGWNEGRDPSTNFDTQQYLAQYTDVANVHIDPLTHYLQFGIHEGRSAFADGLFG